MAVNRCGEEKVNRSIHNFQCDKNQSHPDAHTDPITGTRWKHPARPYGVRGAAKSNGPRGKTRHGCTWSAADMKGYTRREAA